MNFANKSVSKRSALFDDCGVWDTPNGTSLTTHYLLGGGGKLKKIYHKNGVYCTEKQVNWKREYVPVTPQSDVKNVGTQGQIDVVSMSMRCHGLGSTSKGGHLHTVCPQEYTKIYD